MTDDELRRLLRETAIDAPSPGPGPWDDFSLSDEEIIAMQRASAERGWRAMMLAPTLEICRALLRGERVPIDCLNEEWVRRFGLRKRAS